MRWSWLRAAILGLIVGPSPLPEGRAEAESLETEELAAEASSGHCIRGPHYYVWDEDPRRVVDWAVELRSSRVETVDAAHWRAVAAKSAALPPVLTQDDETQLAKRIEAASGSSSLPPLGLLLCHLPSLDRTCLIASWATSTDVRARRSIAEALAAPFEAVGVRAALEYLQDDPSAEVRRLARSAAARRASAGGAVQFS